MTQPTDGPWPGGAAPAAGEVHVHWTAVAPESALDRLAADLDGPTRARIARMRRPEDRARGVTAHALLRRLLAAAVGAPDPAGVPLAARCTTCGSTAHGKPHLAGGGPEFNLSHSGAVVAVALATGLPVGVDVEECRPLDWTPLRRNVFGDAEWHRTGTVADPAGARFAGWARKEAAVKVTGHGLALPLSRVPVEPGTAPDDWTVELPEGAGRVRGRDVVTAPGHAAAVAWPAGAGPVRVLVRSADLSRP